MSVISCGVVIVRREGSEYKFLMMRSFNYFECGAKGKQEAGETNLQTALREVQEETTIKPYELDFKWGLDFIETEPYSRPSKIARFFLAETTRETIELPISPTLGVAEHNEWRWCEYSEACKLVNPRIRRILDWAQEKINGRVA
jgi:bis(5'-nucleosidyl)-tetraphosphatase